MHLDVAELRDFYATPLGAITRRILADKLRARWPSVHGEMIAALGFAPPYLSAYRGEASHLVALMPETQGALVWPSESAVLSALVEEEQLPLRDNSLDRLMIMHGLEVTERASVFLREAWRVLKPEGRLLITVPNRRGLWAHVETTPFGQGQPYSRSQLETLLRQSLFSPIDCSTALHVPPFDRRFLERSAMAWERIGSKLWPALGGVLIVEARKETVAPIVGKAARVQHSPLPDLATVRRDGNS